MSIAIMVSLLRVAGTKLKIGPGRVDAKVSAQLAELPLKARNQGDLNSAVVSAGYYAKKLKETMFVYPGNSYGHAVWRVSQKSSEYSNPINNSGTLVYSVTPELIVSRHEVERPVF